MANVRRLPYQGAAVFVQIGKAAMLHKTAERKRFAILAIRRSAFACVQRSS